MKCELQIKKLKDLCIDGKGKYGIPASAVPFDESLYTYLRITDITDDGRLNKSGLVSVDDAKAQQYILQPNDIVFARTGGSTGRNYFYDGSDGELVYAGFLIKFSIDPQMVNPRYIKYYCQSQLYKDWVNSFNTGSTRGNINAQTFANMEIPVPQRDQQDLLVQMLSVLDHKIDLNNKINANLQQQAQAIFKSWFVDFELFQDGEFVESELGLIPKGWTVKRADSIFDISIGKTPPRKEKEWFSLEKTDIKWVSISDMGKCGVYISDTSERLTHSAIEKHNIKIVPDNTVILSFKLTVGRVAITHGTMATNEAIAHFKTSDDILVPYLYCFLKNFNFQTLGSTSSIATAVNSKLIKQMQILYPNDLVIESFASTVSPLFNQIKVLEEENKKLSAIRDSLLPKLMSGELSANEVQ
ncbi:restriction endonuclease subunit S [Pseudoflavonifractor sp. An44]|uniref:restriction endonuclease subunit S n=1 Tax=Pseudoflavonifractor sp. An44 TaxID=1965635 RepID=UPI001302629F|nr:restriction endonuclease subunit S [Pseudoflavonifractor sp. An44]